MQSSSPLGRIATAILIVVLSALGQPTVAGPLYGNWTCALGELTQCSESNPTVFDNLEALENSVRQPAHADMVSMALAYPVLTVGAAGGTRTKVVYNRGGGLTGHVRTRPYSYTGHTYYAIDDGQNGYYPANPFAMQCPLSNTIPPVQLGFEKYCASVVDERQRLSNSPSYGAYLCMGGFCYQNRDYFDADLGGTEAWVPLRSGTTAGMPGNAADPAQRIGGYLAESSTTQKYGVRYNNRFENGLPANTHPDSVINIGVGSYCTLIGGGVTSKVECRFPMTRFRWMFCNIGFKPSKQYFARQDLLIPPHSLEFEQALPCIPVSPTGTDSEKFSEKAQEKGIPGMAVTGADPNAPSKLCQGNPCVPGTGEKLVFEPDFEFSGHSFQRTYRSLRKGRSYGFIDDNWTHSWATRVLYNSPLAVTSGAAVFVSTSTGDFLAFSNPVGGVYRSASERGVVLKAVSGGSVAWQLLKENGEYQDFDSDGRLTALGSLSDPSTRLTFTYLDSIHPLDWSWWAIKDVTDARGRSLRFEYDVNSTYQPRLMRVVLSSDPGTPSLVTYHYYGEGAPFTDVFWRLKQAEYPDGRVRRYQYEDTENLALLDPPLPDFDRRHYLTGIELGTLSSTPIRFATYAYDLQGRVVESYHGGVALKHGRVQMNYAGATNDAATSTITVTHALGNVRTFQFPALGQSANLNALNLASIVSDGAGTVTRTYNATGGSNCGPVGGGSSPANDWRLCTVQDGRGFVTWYQYAGAFLVRKTEGLTSALEAIPEITRTTAFTWDTAYGQLTSRRVCKGKVTCDAAAVWDVLKSDERWVYSNGKLTARCEYDAKPPTPPLTPPPSYACGSAVDAPDHVRQYRFIYWLAGASTGLLRIVDGPRISPIADETSYAYYGVSNESGCGSPQGLCYRAGDLWSITNAAGQVTTFNKYDRRGRLLSSTDPNGVVTEIEYDPQGRVKSRKIVGPNGAPDAITSVIYEQTTGMVDVVTQPDNSSLNYDYDAALRVKTVTDTLGNSMEYKRDAAGNVTIEKILEGGIVRRRSASQYDTLGRLRKQLDALDAAGSALVAPSVDDPMSGRQVAEFFYDENGNRRQSIDGLLRVTDLEYDPLNRVNKVLDALRPICPVGDANCGRTSTSYDALDQQTQVTDPKGLSTNYTFDGLGQLDALNSPDTGSTTYTQDQAGNRIRQVDSRGVRTDYDYDSLNRLRSITFPTGNAGRNSYFEYDTVNSECATTYRIGRLTRMVDSSGSTEYCYDHRGNVTRKRQRVVGRSDMTVAYTYSVADRLASTTLPGGTSVVYQRDQVGRISSITVNGSPLINSVAYYPWGPVRSLSYANGTSLTKTYDANYAITYIASSRPFEFHLDYTTDVTGNIKQIQDQDQIRQFQVDPLDRLTDVLSYGQTIDRYTYDAVGNRLSAQAGSVTEPYVYDGNRLSRVGGIKRGYDAAGNTTDISNVQQRFRSYDERNRLISAGGGGRNPNDYYDYNGRGERVIQYKDASGERGYLYDESGSILVFETDDLDQHRSIVYLDALPVAVVDPVGLYTIDTDHLGTPREIVNFANQAIVWQWELVTGGPIDGGGNAFGDRAPFEYWGADGNKFVFDMRFPGQIYDQTTGLNYNYFRDYEPGTGRYVESDPIGLEGGSSTYSYVYSSPTTMVDPEGLSAAIAIGRPMTGFGPRPLFNSPVDLDQPLPLTDNPALRPYKDPDGEFCKSLERRIENSKKEIFDKRYPDLATNPGGLPRRIGPGENLEDTVRGHEKLLNRRLRETRKLEDEYDQLCKPPVTFTLLCN